ncbi:MAG TPA: hypothetical protein VM490_10800, partial [Armatimonadaceae bacterium]|nr:hypothetical protein [Armatimonadaceae bacterium]
MRSLTQPVGVGAAACLAAVALAACAARAADAERATHTFVYVADRPLKSVHVAGTFNQWDRGAAPMRADADGRTWRRTMTLPYGGHRYKFVLDGETWVTDPKATGEN